MEELEEMGELPLLEAQMVFRAVWEMVYMEGLVERKEMEALFQEVVVLKDATVV